MQRNNIKISCQQSQYLVYLYRLEQEKANEKRYTIKMRALKVIIGHESKLVVNKVNI